LAHFLLRKKPGFPGVPVVNPLRQAECKLALRVRVWTYDGFTSGVLPTAKLHTGYKPWIQAWSLREAQTPEAKLQRSFATPSNPLRNSTPSGNAD
jgi:hypothetical protein